MRSVTNLSVFLLLLGSGVASAQSYPSNRSLPQNRQPQTEERYQQRNELADVRLDGGRDSAFIQLPITGQPLDYLELRAGRARLFLNDVEVIFADGSSMHTGDRGVIQPFEGRVIDLPHHASAVTAVIPHYQTFGYRRFARLQVFGVPEHRDRRWARRGYYRRY
jgi:hypothetical protein